MCRILMLYSWKALCTMLLPNPRHLLLLLLTRLIELHAAPRAISCLVPMTHVTLRCEGNRYFMLDLLYVFFFFSPSSPHCCTSFFAFTSSYDPVITPSFFPFLCFSSIPLIRVCLSFFCITCRIGENATIFKRILSRTSTET